MTSRQVREIRKQKLLLEEQARKEDSKLSPSSSEEDSSSSPSLRRTVNPFAESDSGDEGEEDGREAKSHKSSEAEDEEQYHLDLSMSKNAAKEEVEQTEDEWSAIEQMAAVEEAGESKAQVEVGGVPLVVQFSLSNFDPVVEMSRLAATRRRQHQGYSTLVGRKHGWLLHNSDLLQKLEEHKSGVRWVGFDPRREIYFNMVVAEEGREDGFTRFNFIPNERYLSTFHVLEEIISRGDVASLYSFVAPSANPFHPSANYFLAESHMQQDQFETSFKFILQGISSFQCGLHHAWNPSIIQRNTRGDALPTVLFDDLDPASVASALAVIADDLLVDWSLNNAESTDLSAVELRRSSRSRKEEVEEALRAPALGNLLFIKLLLLYASSLLQRGCPRTSLEVFRLINAMTCGRDIAHTLLFIPDAAVRSRQLNLLIDYCDSYLSMLAPCIDYLKGQAQMSGLGKLIDEFGAKEFPFLSRLDLFIPQYTFAIPLFFARKFSPRELLERMSELKSLSATDLYSFINDSIGAHIEIKTVAETFSKFRDVKQSLRDEIEQSQLSESVYTHLCLLRALYLFPAFPTALCQHLDTHSRNVLDTFLRTSKFFKRDLQYTKLLQGYQIASSSSVDALINFIQQGRSDMVNAYAKQSSELWAPLLPWIKGACETMENIAVLEHAAEPLEVGNKIFDHQTLKPMLALAPYIHLPGLMVQYAGVRASEFDGKNPIIPDMLLNSAPECVETAPAIARRQDSAALQGLQRWWRQFRDRTGAMNLNSNGVVLFLQALLPWSRVDFTGRM